MNGKAALPKPEALWEHWHQGIETPRLLLRPLDHSLTAKWLALHEDPEVQRFVMGPPLTRADCWRDLAFAMGHALLRGFSMWAVYEKNSGDFIGRVGPWMPEGWPGLEIGWALCSQARGKGYGVESVRAALDWSADYIGVPTAIHSIHPDNLASKNLAQKIGAQLLGTAEVSGQLHQVWVSALVSAAQQHQKSSAA